MNSTFITGMTAQMVDSYRRACIRAFGSLGAPDGHAQPKFVPRLVQGHGHAAASAGFHEYEPSDDNPYHHEGKPYCCSIDISVKSWWGLTGSKEGAIRWMLYNLALENYAGFYRHAGSFQFNRHIHATFVGHISKPQTQRQVADWCEGRNGLSGHGNESWWVAPVETRAALKAMFLKTNPGAAHFF